MSVDEAITLWLSYIHRHKSEETHKLYRKVALKTRKFLPDDIKNLSLEHLEHFMASLDGLKPNSYNAYLTTLKSFGGWLETHDLLNPARKLKYIRTLNIPARVLTEEEYSKVLSVCKDNERDAIAFLGNTGLRLSEFLSLSAVSISADGKFLKVLGKGNKPRIVPINQTISQIIARNPDMKFTKSDTVLRRLCYKLAHKASIPRFTPHSLRHYFATALMQRGVPISRISKILGHASVLITEKIYIHWCSQDLEGITDVLDE